MKPSESVAFAKKYLEDILSFFGVNILIETRLSDDVIEINIPSSHLNGFLIGTNGETLRSLQYLVSTTLKNKSSEIYRINIDIANYKAQRADRLVKKITDILKDVQQTGQEKALEPMNPADRRVVHQAVSEYPDLITNSVGEGPERHIVISKK